jgi:hypothetical protein
MRGYTAIPAAIASATLFSLAGDLPDEAKARTGSTSAVSVRNPPRPAAPPAQLHREVGHRPQRAIGRAEEARLVFRLSADGQRDALI